MTLIKIMKISALLASVIKQEEGLSLTAYKDGAGFVTVGWGHLSRGMKEGDSISQADADKLFAEDVQECEDAVNLNVSVPLSQNQFDSLSDFCFNMGAEKFRNSGLLRELNAGHYGEVPKRLMLWSKIKQKDGSYKISKGLLHRRKREVNIWERGDYEDPRAKL